jgi:uncharacterized protein DUF4307
MTAVAVWFGLASTVTKPLWQTVSWKVESPQMTLIKYEVTRPEGMTVSCVFEAQEVAHGLVGRKEIVIPASLGRHVVDSVVLRTSSEAVIGQIRSCREVPAGTAATD